MRWRLRFFFWEAIRLGLKGDKFSEVIVDHKTGKTAKTEAITSGEDLTAAKAQSSAMAKAKVSLRSAESGQREQRIPRGERHPFPEGRTFGCGGYPR